MLGFTFVIRLIVLVHFYFIMTYGLNVLIWIIVLFVSLIFGSMTHNFIVLTCCLTCCYMFIAKDQPVVVCLKGFQIIIVCYLNKFLTSIKLLTILTLCL